MKKLLILTLISLLLLGTITYAKVNYIQYGGEGGDNLIYHNPKCGIETLDSTNKIIMRTCDISSDDNNYFIEKEIWVGRTNFSYFDAICFNSSDGGSYYNCTGYTSRGAREFSIDIFGIPDSEITFNEIKTFGNDRYDWDCASAWDNGILKIGSLQYPLNQPNYSTCGLDVEQVPQTIHFWGDVDTWDYDYSNSSGWEYHRFKIIIPRDYNLNDLRYTLNKCYSMPYLDLNDVYGNLSNPFKGCFNNNGNVLIEGSTYKLI